MVFETWGTKFNWIMKHWELHRVLFHLYKEHSIKCFFIWTGGVGLLSSPPLFHRLCLPGFWPRFSPAFHCLFLLPVVSHNAHTPCLLTGWWKSPTLPLEMLITEEGHNGFSGWCIGNASRGFWCLHFMGRLLSCCWDALVLWRLHLT